MFAFKSIMSRLVVTAVALCIAVSASSSELRSVTVELEEGRYILVSEAWLNVSPDALYRVLTNYDLFVKFSSSFVESRDLAPTASGDPRFFTRMEACVLWFCKSFERNGRLILEPPFDIESIADPKTSDFDYSHETWHLSAEGDGTLMLYTFDMDPSFWVPPIVGPYFMKRALHKSGENAINRIEAVAQGREPEN